MSDIDIPWLQSGCEQFARLHAHLPHALLIHGQSGLGKQALGLEIAAALICEEPRVSADAVRACGKCKNCTFFNSFNHPDFHYISTELNVEKAATPFLAYTQRYLEPVEKRGKRKPRRVISVDQIRALIDTFALANHSAEHKLALIEPAEAMNVNAANALLKLLEEPAAGSVLILVCNDQSRLPMTIRSRCVSLSVEVPANDQAIRWLEQKGLSDSTARKALAISSGRPLLAQSYAQSDGISSFEGLLDTLNAVLTQQVGPVDARERLLKLQALPVLVGWLQMVLNWLIRDTRAEPEPGELPWRAYQRNFSILSRTLNSASQSALFVLYDELLQLKQQDLEIVNPAMLIDKWLISFIRRLT